MSGHDFDRRTTDANYQALSVRLKSLEALVHEVVVPDLNGARSMVAEIHAKNDEMYAAFTKGKNGVLMVTRLGDQFVKAGERVNKGAEWMERTGKRVLFWAAILIGTGLTIRDGRIPDWVFKLVGL